jgi:hypothetical protein
MTKVRNQYSAEFMTPAVKYGIKHLVDIIRQPDDKSLGTLEQVT